MTESEGYIAWEKHHETPHVPPSVVTRLFEHVADLKASMQHLGNAVGIITEKLEEMESVVRCLGAEVTTLKLDFTSMKNLQGLQDEKPGPKPQGNWKHECAVLSRASHRIVRISGPEAGWYLENVVSGRARRGLRFRVMRCPACPWEAPND